MKKIKVSLIITTLLLFLALAGCGMEDTNDEADPEARDIIPVEVEAVGRKTIARYVELSGEVDADGHVTVASQLGGKVEEIMVGVGDNVGKGDTLLRLDNRELASQLNRTEAELEQARQNYYLTRDVGLPQQLTQADNRLREAELEYENTRKNLERIKSLYEADAVSLEELEQVETRYELVKMAYETALDSLAKEKESQQRELAMLEAQLKSAGEALEAARLNYEKSFLDAPISGTVTSVKAKKGQEVNPGTPLVTIVDYNSMYVELKLTERLLTEIEEGTEVFIELPITAEQYRGTVDEIDLTPLEGTRTYPAKAYFEVDEILVRIGQQASLQVLAEREADTLVVPAGAVLNDNDTITVFVVEDSLAREQTITTGIHSENEIEVLDGLNEGEKLVIEGQHFLHDGQQVEIVGGDQD